jgi:dihydrodipicolinate synthase/N-acetylneuraminate lyase
VPEKIPFGGIAPMTTTLCEQGELLLRAIRTPVDFLVRERFGSLAVGGSTGEGQTLSTDALRAGVSVVREAIPGQSAFRSAGRPQCAVGLPASSLQSSQHLLFLEKCVGAQHIRNVGARRAFPDLVNGKSLVAPPFPL